MNTALAERDDVTYDGEIVEHRAPLTLFGTDDPSAVVERATRVATVLADVIKQRQLSARIGNRDHIMLEGWTLLGSMTGVFGEIEWTRSLDDGWEARAVARTMAGAVVGAAEAMCTRAERTWKGRDEYAIRSMAQTRALSKALRLPLGFIVELAGFAATPAEEMDQPQGDERAPAAGRRAGSQPATTRSAAPRPSPEDALRDAIAEAAMRHGLGSAALSLIADAVGVPKGQHANEQQLRAILARIETPASGVPTAAGREGGGGAGGSEPASPSSNETAVSEGSPDSSGSDGPTGAAPASPQESAPGTPTDEQILAAAGEGAELLPPKPGSAEYRALPSGTERAQAKAYWDRHKAAEGEQESLAEVLGAPTSD